MSMFFFAAVITCLVASYGFADYSALDSAKCHLNDPNVNDCVLKALNSLKLQTGREGKAIDPSTFWTVVVPTFSVTQETSRVNYSITLENYTLKGLGKYDVHEVRFDPKTMNFSIGILYDAVTIDGNYEFGGSLLAIPVRGKGIGHAGAGPINATLEVHGEIANHNEIEYFNPTAIKIRMVIANMGLYLNGLFGQNRELGRVTNEALNANSKLLADAITPAAEEVHEKMFLKTVKFLARKMQGVP